MRGGVGLGMIAAVLLSPIAPVAAEPEPRPAADRQAVLGPFLDAHWQLPIAAQGEGPEGWSEAELDLDPATCGSCHPKQYAEWKTSFHAGAYSPGFAGQLIEGYLAAPSQVRACQTCHTPLAEQQPHTASGDPEPLHDPALRRQGLVCAGCHVRSHRRFGPPRRADAVAAPEPRPHGGFTVRPEYEEARFCAPCHQFFDDPGVAGKPIENTWVEWKNSPQAAEGRTCQSCHMPDRAHLWRGIHHPETVREAVDAALVARAAGPGRVAARLTLTNRDVGHRFPTYTTPRVFLEVWQEDAEGEALEETREEAVIARVVDFGRGVEISDTRLAPGDSANLDYDADRHPDAATLVGRVRVDPDFHYRGVFESLLERYEDPHALELIAEAHRRTLDSAYDVVVLRETLPPPTASP